MTVRRAFTLVEAAMSVAVVGVLLTCAITGIGAVARQRRVVADRRAAVGLAQQLLAEVVSQPFAGPTNGSQVVLTRPSFACLADYDGYTESPPTLRDGSTLSDYAGWRRAVSVAYLAPDTLAVSASATSLRRATVTVTAPTGATTTLVGLRADAGVNEYVPPTATKLLASAAINVQAGVARTARAAGRPMNVTASQN